jgi:hypothetical protein
MASIKNKLFVITFMNTAVTGGHPAVSDDPRLSALSRSAVNNKLFSSTIIYSFL